MSEWSNQKILYIAAVDPSAPTGPGVNEREFISSLFDRFGSHCHAVFLAPEGSLPESKSWQYSAVHPVFRKTPLSFITQQLHLYRCGIKLIKEKSFDLIVSRISPFPIYLLALASVSHRPLVLKGFGDIMFNLWHQGGGRRLVARIGGGFHWRIVKGIAEHCVAVDVCTDVLKKHLESNFCWLTDKLFVVENATNTRRFYPKSEKALKRRLGIEHLDPIVGYIGGAPSERGARQLVQIAPHLIERFPSIGFLVVGDDPGLPEIKAHITRRGLWDRFFFTGTIDYRRVPSYANLLNVGVAFDEPSKVAVTGNSNQKIRQYLSVGVPVVAGGGGNAFLKEEKLGDVVDGGDNAAILESISKWLALSAKGRKEFASRARDYAVANLSVDQALEARLGMWAQRL